MYGGEHMSINVIAHNLQAMNADRTLGINTGNKNRAMEKLASGYRINRSADDAAGLAISEKMRRLIRGLNKGTENAQDGASWVQIGDGALEEAHSMLHRMTQLTVQSLNGTWTDSDRAAMQAEFEQLQKEIDRLTDTTTFNEKRIFAEHEIPYYQFEGNIQWMPEQKHAIGDDNNILNITYRMAEGESPQTVSIQVPMGLYTTKELVDEIDTALENAGLLDKGMQFEYTTQGTCNLNLEGGVSIDEVTGGLAYLLYDVYEGGSTGALIGTTAFLSDDKTLSVALGKNDELSFDIVSLDGNKTHMELKVPTDPGGIRGYTRPELIDWLNESLKDTSVVAVKYGQGIKLTSDDSIITGLKGNMFRVDDEGYTSVFYDNIGYGPVTMLPGVLTGGGVLSTQRDDLEHGHYYINSSNNELLVKPNGSDTVTTLKILPDGNSEGYFTMEGMRDRLNELFRDNNLELTASIKGDKNQDDYQGLVITSLVKGLESDVGIDPASSAYNTLFVTRAYNRVEQPESYVRDKESDKDAYYNAGKTFSQDSWPLVITADGADQNNKFILTVNQKRYEITLNTGVDGVAAYNNAGELVQAVQNAITALKNTITDAQEKEYLESIKVSNLSSPSPSATSARLQLSSTNRGVDRINVSAASDATGKVNQGYKDIFTTTTSYTSDTKSGLGNVTLNESITFPVTIYDSKKIFRVTVAGAGGGTYDLTLDKGPYNSYDEILAEINAKLPKATDRTDPVVFDPNPAAGRGETKVYTGSGQDGSITQATIPKLEAQGAGDQQG
ncbi:MAG: flagellin, partial [Lachnospiraceae bacterium]|nr:flagellin [Lachnospiraceae bacterium]